MQNKDLNQSQCCNDRQRKSIPKYFQNEIQQCTYYKKVQHIFNSVFNNYHKNQNKLFRDSVGDALAKREYMQTPMYFFNVDTFKTQYKKLQKVYLKYQLHISLINCVLIGLYLKQSIHFIQMNKIQDIFGELFNDQLIYLQMNFLRKFRRQFYVIENKTSKQELNLNKKLPLFNTELSSIIEEQYTFDQLRNMSLEQQQDYIFNNYELMEHYKQIGPYQIYSVFKNLQNCFVIKAEYLPDNKLLQMEVMDVDGFYTKFVQVESLIPQNYSDYLCQYSCEVPYLDFVNKDMIFSQDGCQIYFLFLEDGVWNEQTANLKDFDFRNLYSEGQWQFKQINY